MAIPASGEIHMKGLHNEKVNDDYNNATDPSGPVTMHDLVNGGNTQGSTVSYESTNTSGGSEPNTSTPHSFDEWYSYDHDFVAGAPSIPIITFTQPSNSTANLVLNYAMDGSNTRVYFYAGSGTTLVYFNGDGYKTSGGTINYSDTNHTYVGYPVYGAAVGPNDTFSVRARGYFNSQFSAYSDVITGYTLPGTPSFTSSTPTTTSIAVSWSAPTGGVNSTNGYRYYFGLDSNVTNNTAYDQGTTSKTVSGLVPNQIYYAAIQAKGDGGHFGAISSTASDYTQAATPHSLTASSITATSVVLGWTAGAGNAPTSYTIYFGTNPSSSGGSGNSPITNISGGSTSYTKTSIMSNETYYFFIRAIADTNSAVSSVSSAFLTPPTSVTAITVNSFTSTTANISWTHNVGAGDETITYTVKTHTANNYANSTTNITTSGTTTGTITGLSQNNTNRIWVVATNSAGSAAEFGPLSFETRMAPPASISFSSVTATSMTVNWTNSDTGDLEDGDSTQVRFGTNSNHASNTLYTVAQDDFSKSFTGLTHNTQHYVSVAGYSEYGIVGDAATNSRTTAAGVVGTTQRATGTGRSAVWNNDSNGETIDGGTQTIGSTANLESSMWRVVWSGASAANTSTITLPGSQEVKQAQTGAGMGSATYTSSPGTFTMNTSKTHYLQVKENVTYMSGPNILTRNIVVTNNSVSVTIPITWSFTGQVGGASDRRLKTDIKKIRTSVSGIPIYEFRFKDDLDTLWEGTIAQDLLEMGINDVVGTNEDGFYTVDYDKIDVDQIQVIEMDKK